MNVKTALTAFQIAAKNVIDDPFDMISMAAEQNDKFALTNIGLKFLRENKIKEAIEILERASKLGFGHAGFLLGLADETNGLIEDNAIKFYRKAAKDGDALAQYKFGLFLEENNIKDDNGLDCFNYFRLSAYQRYREGVLKYCECLEGERKDFYSSLVDFLPYFCENLFFLWSDWKAFYKEFDAMLDRNEAR